MIPHLHFRFCPRCRSPRIQPEKEHGIFCTACGFLFFFNSAAAVSAIIQVRSGILLVQRKKAPRRGYLDLPGGFVSPGESLEAALKRELKEEINLEISRLRYFGSFPTRYRYKGLTYFVAEAVFLCRLAEFKPFLPNDEVSGWSIYRPADIDIEKLAFPSTRQALGQYRDRTSSRSRGNIGTRKKS
jgi:NAD+ diphosphatase